MGRFVGVSFQAAFANLWSSGECGPFWIKNCRSQEREKYVVISLKGAQQQDIPTKLTL